MARQDECHIGTILFVVKQGRFFVSMMFTQEYYCFYRTLFFSMNTLFRISCEHAANIICSDYYYYRIS